MKVRVTLYVGGTTFEEVVHVAKLEDAKKTALSVSGPWCGRLFSALRPLFSSLASCLVLGSLCFLMS
jgi:hypothetical protein